MRNFGKCINFELGTGRSESVKILSDIDVHLLCSLQTMGGTFSGKQQDCTKGIYALAGERNEYAILSTIWLKTSLAFVLA